MITISTENFLRQLVCNRKNIDIPIEVEWAVTQRCNINCIHCYLEDNRSSIELSFEKSIELIDKLYNIGCLYISFTGGEPFIRDDFMDIYIYAKKKGFLISILSNGTKITDKIARVLKEYPPLGIEITVNGIDKDTYESITKVSGSFSSCMNGIDLCIKHKLPLTIKSNGIKLNQDQIPKIKKWVKNLDGNIMYRFDPVLLSSFDKSKDINSLRLTPKTISEIELSDDEMKNEIIKCHDVCSKDNGDYMFNCHAFDNSLYIDPKGDISLCIFLKSPNLNLASLKEKYEELKDFRKIKYSIETKCRTCLISDFCRQCPGRAFLEHNNMENPVDYFCELAKKHYEVIKDLT